MNDDDILRYARASAALLDLPLSEDQARRVSVHLARTAAMAAQLDVAPLAAEDEPAALYCPAPFPGVRPS
jgi:hypothetical protein